MTYSQESRASAFQPFPGTNKVWRWKWHLPRRQWKCSLVSKEVELKKLPPSQEGKITYISKIVITPFMSPSPNMWNNKAFLCPLFPFCISDTNLFLHCISVNTPFHFFSQFQLLPFLSSHWFPLNVLVRSFPGHLLSGRNLLYYLWPQLAVDWSYISG